MADSKKAGVSRNAPQEVDDYLSYQSPEVRKALKSLRDVIRAAAPEVTERVAYKIPVFRLRRDLVAMAAHKHHCSFYTMSPKLVELMRNELSGFDVNGATIHFTPEKPLPVSLITKIVKAREKELM